MKLRKISESCPKCGASSPYYDAYGIYRVDRCKHMGETKFSYQRDRYDVLRFIITRGFSKESAMVKFNMSEENLNKVMDYYNSDAFLQDATHYPRLID